MKRRAFGFVTAARAGATQRLSGAARYAVLSQCVAWDCGCATARLARPCASGVMCASRLNRTIYTSMRRAWPWLGDGRSGYPQTTRRMDTRRARKGQAANDGPTMLCARRAMSPWRSVRRTSGRCPKASGGPSRMVARRRGVGAVVRRRTGTGTHRRVRGATRGGRSPQVAHTCPTRDAPGRRSNGDRRRKRTLTSPR